MVLPPFRVLVFFIFIEAAQQNLRLELGEELALVAVVADVHLAPLLTLPRPDR
jgi:hypothetical protein